MGTTYVTKTCRPIRLGFLVRPPVREDLEKAIEINTLVWGGILNPLIPTYQKIPASWGDRTLGPDNAVALMRGYIQTYQPDYLVRPDGLSLPSDLFPDERILAYSDVMCNPQVRTHSESGSCIQYGLDMMHVYLDAYNRVYRFKQRHPPKEVIPALSGRLRLFGQAHWGTFPNVPELEHYKRSFVDVFQPDERSYGNLESLDLGAGTPLSKTAYRLERSGSAPEPCLFVLDPTKPIDLLDYWNLRACGGLCIPLPISHASVLGDEIRAIMTRHLRQLANNDPKLAYPQIVSSRSLKKSDLTRIIRLLKFDVKHRCMQGNYPRLWSKQEASWNQAAPASHHCEEVTEHVETDDQRVVLDALQPSVARRITGVGPRWMNEVSLNDYQPKCLPSSVIPLELERVGRVFEHYSVPGMWTTDIGFAVPCTHKNQHHFLTLPDAYKIGSEYFKGQGYVVSLSDAGHVLQSMVNVAGGLFYGRWFANTKIVHALDRMAKGRVSSTQEFWNVIRTANESEPFLSSLASRHLEYFKERRILSLCLKSQCAHCRQYSWLSLEELAHDVQCHRCTRSFAFPTTSPPKKWGYRTVGPFASAGYANGAYSVFLALRFLSEQLRADTTCVPSVTLAGSDHTLEADFVCFWQTQSWSESGIFTVFGECKTFSEFQQEDIDRMNAIARRFRGAIVAFCTMRDTLTAREKQMIAPIAERGRCPRRGMSWPTPVLVLTARELCVMMPGDFHLKCGHSDAKGLAARMPVGPISLLDLCDASQQEYLGMASRSEWITEFYRTQSVLKRKRRKK